MESWYTGSSKNKENYGLQKSKETIVEDCGTRPATASHSLRE